jgi:hypothetical protein
MHAAQLLSTVWTTLLLPAPTRTGPSPPPPPLISRGVQPECIIAIYGDRLVIIVTPLPRYLNGRCYEDVDQCTHIGIPESREKIFVDLRRLHTFITCRLSTTANCQVVAAVDLLLNKKKATMDETMEAYNSFWGTVHRNQAAYPRMAMGLTDILTASFAADPSSCPAGRRQASSLRHSIRLAQHTRHLQLPLL